MDPSVLSVLARLGKDPWTEAARLTGTMIWATSQVGPPNAAAGATAASGPPPVERTSWPSPSGPCAT